MTPILSSELSISVTDSMMFAKLSGDYNPLHIDPATARRTQFGGTVTHGIHLFLRALDELAARELFDRQEPAALFATFNNPVLTGTTVSMRARTEGSRIRISAETAGRPAFSGTIELGPVASATATIEDSDFALASPFEGNFPPVIAEGTVPLKLSRARLTALFPSLADASATCWIADLLATTQIVGMRCPGMDSIYSGFKLRRAAQPDNSPSSMHYQVDGMDKRFRMVRMRVTGVRLTGTIEAFFRPRPVAQRTMKEVVAVVPTQAFVGHRALVIGGSRGLGELTAKIAAAGGADVAITYVRGKEDAERICAEMHALGRVCTAHHMDVLATDTRTTPEWLANSRFTHVYFFASPPISKNSGRWNDVLFHQFTDTYVAAFAALVEHLMTTRTARDHPMHFLYPSSIFVTHPEPGFAEYSAAKAAGEALCDQLQGRHRTRFEKPRLPRMRTDQTNGFIDVGAIDPFPVMLDVVRNLHS